MQHDVTFANETARFSGAEQSWSRRKVSGPPMFKMMGLSFAAGLLFAHFLTLAGVVSFAVSIGIWWAVSIAVLAIVTALRTLLASSSMDIRLSSLGWSAIPATS